MVTKHRHSLSWPYKRLNGKKYEKKNETSRYLTDKCGIFRAKESFAILYAHRTVNRAIGSMLAMVGKKRFEVL